MKLHDPYMVCEKGRGGSRISGKGVHMQKGGGEGGLGSSLNPFWICY